MAFDPIFFSRGVVRSATPRAKNMGEKGRTRPRAAFGRTALTMFARTLEAVLPFPVRASVSERGLGRRTE